MQVKLHALNKHLLNRTVYARTFSRHCGCGDEQIKILLMSEVNTITINYTGKIVLEEKN